MARSPVENVPEARDAGAYKVITCRRLALITNFLRFGSVDTYHRLQAIISQNVSVPLTTFCCTLRDPFLEVCPLCGTVSSVSRHHSGPSLRGMRDIVIDNRRLLINPMYST